MKDEGVMINRGIRGAVVIIITTKLRRKKKTRDIFAQALSVYRRRNSNYIFHVTQVFIVRHNYLQSIVTGCLIGTIVVFIVSIVTFLLFDVNLHCFLKVFSQTAASYLDSHLVNDSIEKNFGEARGDPCAMSVIAAADSFTMYHTK